MHDAWQILGCHSAPVLSVTVPDPREEVDLGLISIRLGDFQGRTEDAARCGFGNSGTGVFLSELVLSQYPVWH